MLMFLRQEPAVSRHLFLRAFGSEYLDLCDLGLRWARVLVFLLFLFLGAVFRSRLFIFLSAL